MSLISRKYVLNRRGTTTNDISSVTVTSGNLNLEQVVAEGIWRYNGVQQIGIATSQEVGLSSDRYPVRIVISTKTDSAQSSNVDTVVNYWRVENASGVVVRFQRKPDVEDRVVSTYYKLVQDLDTRLWEAFVTSLSAVAGSASTESPELITARNIAYQNALLPNPEPAHQTLIFDNINAVIERSIAENKVPKFQISATTFMVGIPHGLIMPDIVGFTGDYLVALETFACIKENHKRLVLQYPNCEAGAITLAAVICGSMFRYGLYEAYERQEYYTVVCNPVAGNPKGLLVSRVDPPKDAPPLEGIVVGQSLDVSDLRIDSNMVHIAMAAIVAAGQNHYSFNHTTGGKLLVGPLLSLLTANNIARADQTDDDAESLTRLFYQVLHPVNKRAIANIFFSTARVTSHGKCTSSRRYNRFDVDSFISIRNKPYPAGAHKAFICATVLKRVIGSHLTPFLPWVASITTCIDHCKSILNNGARAHMGSMYYTGYPSVPQSSELDNYLPELAAFVQIMARQDSIAMSPHLSPEVAARANTNWSNLLKGIKSEDVSATNTDTVRAYLNTSGAVHFKFDPDKPETYAEANLVEHQALETLMNII